MDAREIDKLIEVVADGVAASFREAADKAHNEAEFRSKATRIIGDFVAEAGLNLDPREEYTLLTGRADAVYNRFVIEYEPPGILGNKNTQVANSHAIGQVKDYIQGLVHRDRQKAERLAGVAFDGMKYVFVRYRDKSFQVDDPVDVKRISTIRFLRMLASLSREKALIAENLVEDFGEGTSISSHSVSTLYHALVNTNSDRTTTLFQQWSLQFSEVCDYEKATGSKVSTYAMNYGIDSPDIDPFQLYFCIHTYYAFVIKMIAVLVAYFYLMPKLGTSLHSIANMSSEKLRSHLEKIEDGDLFADMQIKNFLEADFFGWYLDNWDESIDGAFRQIIAGLADYSLVTLDVDPEQTRDLMKSLYQNLMPKTLRHNLGEYYTPDWLAQRLLNQLGGGIFRGSPNQRLLDPACGSGTFLVLAIKAIREYGWENSIHEAEQLEDILKNVVGFDLNPLAVISARCNYLLALGELIQHRKDDINIPVYLCDSIVTPKDSEDMLDVSRCSFNTAVGQLSVPASLVEAQDIDDLTGLLEECIKVDLSTDVFIDRITAKFQFDPEKAQEELGILKDLYEKLVDLQKKGINGIWARIIKNAFAPLFVGQFDYVVGNPPWINWRHLPERYRRSLKPLWNKYCLFPHKGLSARTGAGMDDISVLMFYVAADKYLKTNGRIGFVITQSVFKSEGGGEGFRRFRLYEDGLPLQVLGVDDMTLLKPFEGAANRTAVILARKGNETRYPVDINLWRKAKRGISVPQNASLADIAQVYCRISQWQGEPIDSDRMQSPWITGRPLTIKTIKRVIGKSAYVARKGATPNLNGVFKIEVIQERPDGQLVIANLGDSGRNIVRRVQCVVENDFVYPLLLGSDVARWRAVPSEHIILAQDPDAPSKAVDENRLIRDFPNTYAYFMNFKAELLARKSSTDQALMESGSFYSVWGVGPYTFAPYKVVWKEISQGLKAAVVSIENTDKTVIPGGKLILIDFTEEDEAHYVCALLNSKIADYIVSSYAVSTQISTSILKRIPIKKYNPASETCHKLAQLSRKSHEATTHDQKEAVSGYEEEIDSLAAGLWGLSDREFEAIRASLADITGH